MTFRKCHTFAMLFNKRKQHPFTAQLLADRRWTRSLSLFFSAFAIPNPLPTPAFSSASTPPAAAAATNPLLCPKQNEWKMTGNEGEDVSARVVLPRMKTHTSSIDAPILQFLDVLSPARCNSHHPLTLPIRTTAPPLSLSRSSYSSSVDSSGTSLQRCSLHPPAQPSSCWL